MGRRVKKTTKPAVKQCVSVETFDNHVIANLAGHVTITEAIGDLYNKITSCETMINNNYKTVGLAIAGINTSSKHQRQINDIMLLIANMTKRLEQLESNVNKNYNTEQSNAIAFASSVSNVQTRNNELKAKHEELVMVINGLLDRVIKLETAQTPPKQEELKTGPMTFTQLAVEAANQPWREHYTMHKYERPAGLNEAITPDVQYQRKTDENIKYVRDNVTYAMRHMCGWGIERKLGNSLFCRILFKQRMDISVQFTDRTMSITFTRRDGQRVDEVFSDFGKGSTTLASIMMFYCLRS